MSTTRGKSTCLPNSMPSFTDRTRSWRAPANFRGRSDAEISSGFLDGDFLENYFTYPDKAKLLAGDNEAKRITSPQSVIEEVLEELQSLH